MPRFIIKTPVAKTIDQVREGFNLSLFKALKPPVIDLEVKRFDGCKKGDEIHLRVGLGFKMDWVSLISDDDQSSDEWYFIDVGGKLPPPLKKWRHRHRVIKREAGGSTIVDDIHFSSGLLPLDLLIYYPLKIQFMLRSPIYRKVFGKV